MGFYDEFTKKIQNIKDERSKAVSDLQTKIDTMIQERDVLKEKVEQLLIDGTPEELEKEREKIAGGKSIYVSGTGIFDNTGKYYIVASEIYTLENADYGISINENSSNIDGSLEYLKAEYEKLKKD